MDKMEIPKDLVKAKKENNLFLFVGFFFLLLSFNVSAQKQKEQIKEIKTEDEYTSLYWTLKGDDALEKNKFEDACSFYEIATKRNPENAAAFYNWAYALNTLARMKQDKKLLKQAFEKAEKAYKINPKYSYNLSCAYALLKKKKKALHYLDESLKNKRIDVDYVLNDEDWKNYLADKDFIKLINKYK